MSLPTLVKTWQFDVNKASATTGNNTTDCQNLMFGIKKSMIGNAGGSTYTSAAGSSIVLATAARWTVQSSSDSSTAGTSDKWVSAANLVGNSVSVAHSWIVLRQTNINSTFDICIDLSDATPYFATIAIAPGGYLTTGLVTTARPAPVRTGGEIVLVNDNYWGGSSSTQNMRYHLMFANDGQSVVIIVCEASQTHAVWMFHKAQSPVTGWTTPSCGMAIASTTGANFITPTNLYLATNQQGFVNAGINSAILMQMYMTGESYNNVLLTSDQVSANDLDTNFPMMPIGLASKSASARGRHGTIFDVFWGLDVNGQASTYPNDTTRQFTQFGSLIFPWNSVAPLIA